MTEVQPDDSLATRLMRAVKAHSDALVLVSKTSSDLVTMTLEAASTQSASAVLMVASQAHVAYTDVATVRERVNELSMLWRDLRERVELLEQRQHESRQP